MKIKLSHEEQNTFIKFLDNEYESAPTNWSEWGNEWCMLNNIRTLIDQKLQNGVLSLHEDELWAVFNFLSARIDEIICKQIGKQEFDDHLTLFAVFHSASNTKYPIHIFCSDKYYVQTDKMICVIDPTMDPEIVLQDPEKYSVKFYPNTEETK